MTKLVLKKKIYFYAIFFVSVLYLFTFNETNSRYLGSLQANKDVLAVPILNLSNDKVTYTPDKMKPGDEIEYTFDVLNTDSGRTNEILLDYYFFVDVDSIIPLQVKIYDINDTQEEELPITNSKTGNIRMPFGTETTRKYKAKIIWNSADNDLRYVNQEAKITIELRGSQVIN